MIIFVDTILDTDAANAEGGEMSLREAIALAEATAGADDIVFSETLLDAQGSAIINLMNDPASPSLLGSSQTNFTGFTVNSADGLTINGDIDGDGVADVELNGGFIIDDRYFITPHFMIGTEGVLTLEALNLIDGGMVFFDDAASAENGTNGNVSPAGSDGEDAFGSILNEGTLTLDRVRIDGTIAIAQTGGVGGLGYTNTGALPVGQDGRDGDWGVTATAGGDGRDGYDGADGGAGGDGGDAAGAILNHGDLTLINSALGPDFTAEAGDGGTGGKGGRGGDGSDGGDGGDSFTGVAWNTTAKEGGDGGDTGTPGAGGVGGDGGDAALGILNIGGTVSYRTAQASDGFEGTALAGAAGSNGAVGDRGTAGSGGLGGETLLGGRADRGLNGVAYYGTPIYYSANGGNAHGLIGGADEPSTEAAVVYVLTDQVEVNEGEEIVFQIGMTTSGIGQVVTVDYQVLVDRIAGSTGDFEAGTVLSGSVEISSGEGAVLTLPTLLDGVIEDDESVTLQITGAQTTNGAGTETVSMQLATVAITSNAETEIDLDNIIKVDDGQETDGGKGNDTIEGSALDDVFFGGAGDDELIGLGGEDSISGGGGADSISGGDGHDLLEGKAGSDEIGGGEGRDTLKGGAGHDRLEGDGWRDWLEGGNGDDTLFGGDASDTLKGGNGDDFLKGHDAKDEIKGGNGADDLRGGDGADRLYGDGGRDQITGGKGDDTLFGGYGRDNFIFSRGDGTDVIRDFQQGRDTIEITRGAGGFGDLTIKQRGDDTKISFADVTILVRDEDAGAFSAGDFIF